MTVSHRSLGDLDHGELAAHEMHATGMRISGVRAVNAIPAVCAADPGIRTYADPFTVSTMVGRGRLPA